MRRVLVLAVFSVIAVGQALAADLPVRTAPAAPYIPVGPPTYNWGGLYVGINGGYGFGQSQWSDPLNPSGSTSSGDFNVNGGLVGLTIGGNLQTDAFVFGIEGDFDWQGLSGSSSGNFCTSLITSPNIGATAAGLSCKTESNWLGTIRGRAGYAWDRVLVYATAGGAGGNVRTALSGLPLQNHAEFGWTAGGGIEVALADNWTAQLEYLFVDLSNPSCNQASSCGFDVPARALLPPTAAIGANNGVSFDENIVRVGVNFIFRP